MHSAQNNTSPFRGETRSRSKYLPHAMSGAAAAVLCHRGRPRSALHWPDTYSLSLSLVSCESPRLSHIFACCFGVCDGRRVRATERTVSKFIYTNGRVGTSSRDVFRAVRKDLLIFREEGGISGVEESKNYLMYRLLVWKWLNLCLA